MNAEEYSRLYALEDRYWWFVGRRRVASRLLEATQATGPVLDFGCGAGVVLQSLQQSGHEAVGLDSSDLALAFCQKRGLGPLVRGDGERIPLRSNTFGAALALDVFEHIEDDARAYAEVYRVLRPGGVLVLSVPAFASLWGPHDVALHHFRRYRRAELVQRLQQVGFQIDKVSYSVFCLFPVVVLTRFIEKLRSGPPRASLPTVPPWLNRALIALQEFEGRLIARINLPWGSSLVAVARKPSSPEGEA